jgi:hypothetical protein
MFQSHEYLQQGQIDRLAIMAKVPASKRQTINEVKALSQKIVPLFYLSRVPILLLLL